MTPNVPSMQKGMNLHIITHRNVEYDWKNGWFKGDTCTKIHGPFNSFVTS